MSLKTSQTVLKVTGVLTIALSIFIVVLGVISMVLGITAGNTSEAIIDNDVAVGAVVLLFAGIAFIIYGCISLVEGIISVIASRNSKFGTAALVFAILGLISCVCSSISSFSSDGSKALISIIIGLAINILVFVAAKTVREDYKNQT